MDSLANKYFRVVKTCAFEIQSTSDNFFTELPHLLCSCTLRISDSLFFSFGHFIRGLKIESFLLESLTMLRVGPLNRPKMMTCGFVVTEEVVFRFHFGVEDVLLSQCMYCRKISRE